jgi:hypothetical protein
MAGGRADFVRFRSWDLAVDALFHSVTHIRALLIIAALPEFARVAMFFGHDAVMRRIGHSWWLPEPWLLNILSNALTAIVFTGIIRYVVNGEGPFWLPPRLWLRNYLLTATVLIVMWLAIAFLANGLFNKVYLALFSLETFDEFWSFWLSKAYEWNSFVLSALIVAAFYPGLGMTSVHGELGLHRLPRWWRKYFLRFLVIAAVLMSICLLLERLYLWLVNLALPALATDASYIGRETLRSLLLQLTQVPMDFLFDIVPAVAIGLVFRVLRANSADL